MFDGIDIGRIGLHDQGVQPGIGRDFQRAAGFDRTAAHAAKQRAHDTAPRFPRHRAGQIAQESAAAAFALKRAAAEDRVEGLRHHGGFRVLEIENRQIRTAVRGGTGQRGKQFFELIQGIRIFRGDHHPAGTDGNDDRRPFIGIRLFRALGWCGFGGFSRRNRERLGRFSRWR